MGNSFNVSSTWLTSLSLMVFAVTILMGGCATAPKTVSEGGFDQPGEREYVAIVLSDLDNKKETGAYATGVTTAMGSEKIVPDLPDSIAGMIKSNPEGLDWVTGVVDTIGGQFDFDTLIVAIPSHATQKDTYLGLYSRQRDVIRTEAYLVDVESNELVGSNRYYARYSDVGGESAALASITSAGKSAISDLISK